MLLKMDGFLLIGCIHSLLSSDGMITGVCAVGLHRPSYFPASVCI